MAEVASAFVSILPSARGFGSKLESGISRDVDGAAKRTGGRFGKVFATATISPIRAFGAAALGIFAGQQITGFLKDAVNGASDLQESTTKIEAIFGSASGAVQKFASQGAQALGQTRLEVLNASANFGTFGKAAGLAGGDLAQFSTGFAQLSTDLASFYNSTPEQAVEAIGAALRGEAEPMRQFGVLLDDATLRNEALKLGLIETTKDALTPQQKVLAAQAAIYKQTKDAQGDFQRTSGGLANQQRILAAQWSDMKTNLGAGLLPIVTRFVTFLNSSGGPAIRNVVNGLGSFKDTVIGVGSTVLSALMPTLRTLGEQFQTIVLPALQQVGAFATGTLIPLGAQIAAALLPALSQLASTIATGIIPAIAATVQFFIQWRDVFIPLGAAVVGYVATVKVLAAVQAAIIAVTKAWAAAQALLNVALSANPIGLVVAAVAAFVAGVIIAYNRSETFRGIVNALWAALKVAGQWVVDVAKKVASFAAEVGGAALSKVRAFASFMLGAYVGSIRSAIGVVGDIIGAIGRFGGALVDAIKFAVRFQLGIIENAGKVLGWFKELPGRIVGALGGLASTLYGVGVNIIQGLINGIKAMAGAAASAAVDVVKSAVDKAKSFLGIRSPSRVFMQIGDFTMQGLIKGFLSRDKEATATMQAVVAKIKNTSVAEMGKAMLALRNKFVDGMNDALEAVRDAMEKKRDRIKGVLDGLKSDFANMSSTIAQAFGGNLFDVEARAAVVPEFKMPEDFDQLTADRQAYWLDLQKKYQDMFTKPAQSAAEVFIENLMGTKGKLKQLSAAFKKLLKWGLSPQFLSQLFQSGNGGLILDLAGGSKAQAQQAGNLFGQVESLSSSLGNQVARADIGPKIDKTNQRLERIEHAIDRLPKSFGKELKAHVSHGQRSSK